MKGGSDTVMRIRRLPRGHRIAHLRALIRQQLLGSIRRQELVALLRAEMTAQLSEADRGEPLPG